MPRKVSLVLILALVLSQMLFPIYSGNAEPGGPGGGPQEGPPPSSWNPANTKIISYPAGVTPIFENTSDGSQGPAGFYFAGFDAGTIDLNTELEFKFQATKKPFMLVHMSNLQSWSYNEATKVVTVKTKPIEFYQIDQGSGQQFHIDRFIVVNFGPNPGGSGGQDQGPPDEANGMWISTNASQWEFGPSEDYDGDGMPSSMMLKLTGKEGTEGFFKMFWPTALLDKMGLTPDTLAGFINGSQISSSTEEVTGGAIITFNLTYSASGLPKPRLIRSASTLSGYKTVEVATGKAAPLTIAANKNKVKKGKSVILSGYVNPKKAKAKVLLYRKQVGEKAYKKVAVAKTSIIGAYKFTVKPTKTAYFKTVTLKGKKKVSSSVEKVTVK